MTTPKRKAATYADIEALPEHIVGEIICGKLITSRRGLPPHCIAASVIGPTVGVHYDLEMRGQGGWFICNKPEIHLGPHVIVPDTAGWRRENCNWDWDAPWFDTAPEWVCEFVTDANRGIQAGAKRRIYAEHGVKTIWYIDLVSKVLDVFERQSPFWVVRNTFTDQDDVCAPPFDAITFPLGRLWPFDKPSMEP